MAKQIKVSIQKSCLIFSLLFSTVGCDQISKQVVRDSLPITGPISYLQDFVRLQFATNSGAFLNLGSGLSAAKRFLLFNLGVSAALSALAFFLFYRRNQLRTQTLVGLTLILGGGLGNLIDRFLFGHVTDFMIFGCGPLHTGIFNFADVAIVLGVVSIAIPLGTRSATHSS